MLTPLDARAGRAGRWIDGEAQGGPGRLRAAVLHELERVRRPAVHQAVADRPEQVTGAVSNRRAALHRLLRAPRRARLLTGEEEGSRSGAEELSRACAGQPGPAGSIHRKLIAW